MDKKAVAIILVLLGASLLLATGYILVVNPEDTDVFKTAAGIIGGLGSLAGGIKEWRDLLKKSKETSTTHNETHGHHSPVQTGDGTLLQVEGGIHIHEAPHEVEPPQPLLGIIHPASTETYIHRGQIESDVRTALKGNGVAAIVGLHAPGGVGKTELARQAMEDLRGQFEDTLWVDVGEKTPEQVVIDMLLACGQTPPETYPAQRQALQARLSGHRYLVVLDDLRTACIEKLSDFLPPSPPNAVLITSRIEQPSHLIPLKNTFELNRMTPKQANDLLEAALGKEVVRNEAETARDLAKRVLWNPLALEIAARRIRQMQSIQDPIGKYLKKLAKGLDELKVGDDPRLNIQAVFDISYNDLTEADKKRFRFLSTFHPSGFSPEAAAMVWNDTSEEASESISRLQNLSLVKPVPGNFERYRLHDLLDEYAALKLRECGEEAEANQLMAEWLADLFNRHYTADPSNAPEVLLDLDNLRRACSFAAALQSGDPLARLIHAARNWFVVLSLYGEWGRFAARALAMGISDKGMEANVLKAMGDVQQFRDDRDAALTSYTEALQLFRAVGSKLGEANVYLSLGGLKRSAGDLPGAKQEYVNALETYQIIGDQYSQARALYRLGDCAMEEDEYAAAMKYYEKASRIWVGIGLEDLVENILKPRIEDVRNKLLNLNPPAR